MGSCDPRAGMQRQRPKEAAGHINPKEQLTSEKHFSPPSSFSEENMAQSPSVQAAAVL
eukprot:bmy_10130T0